MAPHLMIFYIISQYLEDSSKIMSCFILGILSGLDFADISSL